MDDKQRQALAQLLLSSVAQERHGLAPFDPSKHKARDVGLGGPSTEYLATEHDPSGKVMNYPTIWWDKAGNPQVLDADAAYDQALRYEQATQRAFPRFPSVPAAEFSAMNRSALGGGNSGLPLAQLFRRSQ